MNSHWQHVRYTNQRTLKNRKACNYILVDKKISYLLVSKQESRGDGIARVCHTKGRHMFFWKNVLGNVQILVCFFTIRSNRDGWFRQISFAK
jgi:hypothetical protein